MTLRKATRWLAPIVFLSLGGFILYCSVWVAFYGHISKSWPCVEGVIKSARVKQVDRLGRHTGGFSYVPILSYDYTVSGSEYYGSRVMFASYQPNMRCGDEAEARAITNEYRVGREVKVYYRPTDPHDAVLEPGMVDGVMRLCAIGGVFFIVGVVLAFAYGRAV